MPEMAEGAVAFMMSMGKTGYLFPTIAVIEITGGGLNTLLIEIDGIIHESN